MVSSKSTEAPQAPAPPAEPPANGHTEAGQPPAQPQAAPTPEAVVRTVPGLEWDVVTELLSSRPLPDLAVPLDRRQRCVITHDRGGCAGPSRLLLRAWAGL